MRSLGGLRRVLVAASGTYALECPGDFGHAPVVSSAFFADGCFGAFDQLLIVDISGELVNAIELGHTCAVNTKFGYRRGVLDRPTPTFVKPRQPCAFTRLPTFSAALPQQLAALFET